jgi:hypothetical protein
VTLSQILNYLILWCFLGSFVFSLIVIYLFRSGKVYEARTEEGHFKKEMPLKGVLTLLASLGLIIGFIILTNFISLVTPNVQLSFWPLFFLNLALIIIIIAYDTLVIDWWVIGHWRPSFLKLPDAMDKDQMVVHIHRTFITAPLIALLLAALSASITNLLW